MLRSKTVGAPDGQPRTLGDAGRFARTAGWRAGARVIPGGRVGGVNVSYNPDAVRPGVTALSRFRGHLAAAPLTTAYAAVFTATTLLQRAMPPGWVDRVTRQSSTNLVELAQQPVRVLLASAVWIADGGAGYLFYLAVFLVVVARAEQRFGGRWLVVVALAAHVGASLLMALIEWHAIRAGRAPASLASVIDVGVSYVMIGGCAAAVAGLSGRRRLLAAAALAASVAVPLLATRSLWDLGHLLALGCAAATASLVVWTAPRHRRARRAAAPEASAT